MPHRRRITCEGCGYRHLGDDWVDNKVKNENLINKNKYVIMECHQVYQVTAFYKDLFIDTKSNQVIQFIKQKGNKSVVRGNPKL